MEATSELFFAETFKLQFFPKYTTFYFTMLEYCLFWRVSYVHYTIDFPSEEDHGCGIHTNLPERCLIKLAWISVKQREYDSCWASWSSWPHTLWIRLVKISGFSTDQHTQSDLYSIAVFKYYIFERDTHT